MSYNNVKQILHGGDYNPEQWLDCPQILEDDLRLMEEAHINTVTVGIFSWSTLEPQEGHYNFAWLDKVFDEMEKRNGYVILATPSGGRPRWMSQKYEEVNRVDEYGRRHHHGFRHNHCYSSKIYRNKVENINTILAKRYGHRKSLIMWHISNEYSGECFCDQCQENWRKWLQNKYKTLDALNAAWNMVFWSNTITDWNQVVPPSPLGENKVHSMDIDWRRFCSDMTIDFFEHEIKTIKEITPHIPVTTNFMAEGHSTNDFIPLEGIDYAKFAKSLDVVSWDSYPDWHNNFEPVSKTAMKTAFIHDLYYSLKNKPFLIMECTPSCVNWHTLNKSKRPGMHILSSMQQIAHGSDSTLYFQIRRARGNSEKYHGAVIDHDNSNENRVFKEVKKYGEMLLSLKDIKGTKKQSRVAILIDWENLWALKRENAFCRKNKRYFQTLQEHYNYFWENDIPVDLLTKDKDFSQYDLIIAPMLYMIEAGTMNKFKDYVKQGGKLVSTYFTGLADSRDVLYIGGWPQQLQELFGIKVLELDNYFDNEYNEIVYQGKVYQTKQYQSIIELHTATNLGEYQKDFYAHTPALTVNAYGKGQAYYMAARMKDDFLHDFYSQIANQYRQKYVICDKEVSVQVRFDDQYDYCFIMNFSENEKNIEITKKSTDMINHIDIEGKIVLKKYETKVLRIKKEK